MREENAALQQINLGLDGKSNLKLLSGAIGEILIFDRILNPEERSEIEGYLAHKWGIVDQLPEELETRNGLILYYPFNETGGKIIEDYSWDNTSSENDDDQESGGNNLRHAFAVHANLNAPGKFSTGIGLDSTESGGAFIDLGENALFRNQQNWTISTWFQYPIFLPSEANHVLMWASGTNYPKFLDGDERFRLDGLPISDYSASELSGTDEEWHHFALTSDENSYFLYIDGVAEYNSTIFSGGVLGIETIGNTPMSFAENNRFSPTIDDFRVYDRALNPVEISVIYGNGEGDFIEHPYFNSPPKFDNEPVIKIPRDAVLHWDFDNLSGSSVQDSSGYENHGYVDGADEGFDLFRNNSADGRDGQALFLDEQTRIKCTIDESDEGITLSDSFTVSFWVNSNQTDASLLSSGRFSISINEGYLNAQAYIGSRWRETEPVLMPLNSWIHLIFWWDGNKLKLYLNNQEAVPSLNAEGRLTGEPTFYLSSSANPFEGYMDDFRIYSHALNSAERDNAFNFIDSSLVGTFGEEFFYQIETLRGPTDFNATGLPPGLSIDPKSGLIFGTPTKTGLDFNVTIVASNYSGFDEQNMTFFVNPSSQSILFNELSSVKYGDESIDLNWTSTSGLPVSVRIVEGAEFAELSSSQMPTTLKVLKPGIVKIEGSQPGDGDVTYQAAPKVLDEFIISKKELSVNIKSFYRKPDQINPLLEYELIGLVGEDNESEFDRNITLSLDVNDGSPQNPTPIGEYPIVGSSGLSSKYFFTYYDGTLTVR